MMFHHSAGSNFPGSLAIAAALLRGFFNMLVHTLFLITDTTQGFLLRHNYILSLHCSLCWPTRSYFKRFVELLKSITNRCKKRILDSFGKTLRTSENGCVARSTCVQTHEVYSI